jgi:hypothetical protein
MTNEGLNVEFRSKVSTADNCICNACHNVGKVVKLELPETLYRKGVLKTEYNEYWICLNCREKLIQVLMWGDKDGK